jgi:class 3 adenylate cyclase
MPESVPTHRVFVFTDTEGSSQLSIPDKEKTQQDVAAMLEEAILRAGWKAGETECEDRGDGYLLVGLVDVPIRDVVAAFAESLDEALAARAVAQTPLRLRVVVHQGNILRGERGWRGPDLDHAARLISAPEVKATLKAAGPRGRMAFVIAPHLYHSVVRGYRVPDPQAFRMRRVTAQEGPLDAWVTITGVARQPGREADEAAVPKASPAMPSQTVNQVRTANSSPIGNTVNGGINYGTERPGTR